MIRLLLSTPALLGWTGLALIGQGLLILAIYGLVRWSVRQASAMARHRLAAGTLVLVVLSVPGTLGLAIIRLLPRLAGEVAVEPSPGTIARLAAEAGQLFPALGLLWTAGFILALLRLAAGGWRLHRIIAAATPAPAGLSPSFELLGRAGVVRSPRVVISTEVDGPFVAGWGRGVLVLPAGLGSQLIPAEREAVLLHELRHLVRGDFVANLRLRLLAALLWFQPAIWFIANELDRVREECCDDDVIRLVGRPVVLARALVRLEEIRIETSPLALAGTGGALTGRVRRLLSPVALKAESGGCLALKLTLVGIAAYGTASVGSTWAASMTSRAVPVVTIRAQDPAGPFTLEMAGGVVRGMSVAGSAVPRTRLRQSGSRLDLLSEAGQPQLEIEIRNPAAIHWIPRPPNSP